ncbi:MAG TPA: replication-associated recombination protein A [Phycisphaerae bacterium]|nr:replication-associated recombination protein A [Phycisphaerae bacterium]
MPDLFDPIREKQLAAARPLAVRMRPQTLEEFVGQSHILGPGKLLRRMIEADQLVSLLFFGPPGTGKTTLAEIIAVTTRRRFVKLNAASAGVKEVRDVLTEARASLETAGTRTVLFLDEIHRFNRTQQDILLPDVEDGIIVLIGATTLNPFFAINAPLISRSQIFQFEPLTPEEIKELLRWAIEDKERGFGALTLKVTDEAIEHWTRICDGDARRALMALELAVNSQRPKTPAGRPIEIDLAVARESIQIKALVYDPTGDEHYDSASALIKSMRGSDPDAAVYWLARMLSSGEDPRFIARRVAICAAEDIGNADPTALLVAAAAVQMTEFVGMPECRIILSQAVIYLACSPKSNSAITAVDAAMSDVKENRTVPVPRHLRDASYRGAKKLGHTGYQYAHNDPEGYVPQEYLGVDKQYYFPTDRGHEAIFREFLANLEKLSHREHRDHGEQVNDGGDAATKVTGHRE